MVLKESAQYQKEHANCVFSAAKWAATMTFHEAGYTTAAERLAAGIDVGSLTASCVEQARGDVGKAAGLAVSAASRLLANINAQKDGTADALGIALDRAAERDGRYDGSF